MDSLHHYTSIENLALILKSRKIRFKRFDMVDDVKEIEGFPEWFKTYIYISCWTYDNEESIPLWKMYTPNMRGVRITLPKDMFKKKLVKAAEYDYHGFTMDMYSPLSYEETVTDRYFVTNIFDNEECFYKRVIYDDNYPNIYKNSFDITSDSTGLKIQISDLFSLGAYKKEIWRFQNESRFTLYVFPMLPLEHPLVGGVRGQQFKLMTHVISNNIGNEMEYIDVDIDDRIVDNISIRLGPLCNDSDEIIVDALLKKYTKNGIFENSNLDGSIRK